MFLEPIKVHMKLYSWLNMGVRIATFFLRIEPDFFIIGAARSGTTSLFKYFDNNRNVLLSQKKEPNYFSFNFSTFNFVWYRSLFPLLSRRYYRRIVHNEKVVAGESSTYYMFHPLAPKRLQKKYPKAKIIVLLRDPIERSYSHYKLNVSLGREKLSFEEAVDRERDRIMSCRERQLADPNYDSDALHYYTYLERGKYAEQLNNWTAYFPSSQIKFIKSEDLFKTPVEVITSIENFLNVGASLQTGSVFKPMNQSKKQEMSLEVKKKLVNYFRTHNDELIKMTGINFNEDCTV